MSIEMAHTVHIRENGRKIVRLHRACDRKKTNPMGGHISKHFFLLYPILGSSRTHLNFQNSRMIDAFKIVR